MIISISSFSCLLLVMTELQLQHLQHWCFVNYKQTAQTSLTPSPATHLKFNPSATCHMSSMNTFTHHVHTCVSLQAISSSTVKTVKCCVMLSSAVFLTSCTSWASLQNRVWTGSLCQRPMSPALSFCHQFTPTLRLGPKHSPGLHWHNKHD